MALIKCSKCGHTVLSAASKCPGCGRALDPAQRDAIRVDRRRRGWIVVGGLLGVAGIAIGVWAVQSGGPMSSAGAPPATPQPLLQAPLPNPPSADTLSIMTPARESRQPGAVITERQPTRPVVSSPLARVDSATPRESETLWTQTWVNVRERPGTTSTVVKILLPGQPVSVINPDRQWSVVYVDGKRLGYLSVALLTERPPGQ